PIQTISHEPHRAPVAIIRHDDSEFFARGNDAKIVSNMAGAIDLQQAASLAMEKHDGGIARVRKQCRYPRIRPRILLRRHEEDADAVPASRLEYAVALEREPTSGGCVDAVHAIRHTGGSALEPGRTSRFVDRHARMIVAEVDRVAANQLGAVAQR